MGGVHSVFHFANTGLRNGHVIFILGRITNLVFFYIATPMSYMQMSLSYWLLQFNFLLQRDRPRHIVVLSKDLSFFTKLVGSFYGLS